MADQQTPPANPPDVADINPWIISISVMLATFMEVLDTTVVNVSLPHIAGSLSASVDEATWALTSYLVANAIILPMTGWLANQFGRKRLLMAAIVGFTGASFLCGLAPNLGTLIFFRVLQGASGGALQPISQAVMLEAFPPRDRGKAMAFWGLGIVVAPMLGPVLGGWLTDSYSWRWVFYINIPVGVLALFMTNTFIFDPSYIRRTSSKIDYWGIGLLALGIAAVQVMLDKGQEEDWFSSHYMLALLVVGSVCIVAFVLRELIARHPVVDLRVLKDRTYATGVALMTTLGFVLYGSLVLVPVFLQTLLGYPALEAGIAMFPRGLGSFIGMPLVGVMLNRFDPRKLLAVGFIGTAYTLYQLSNLNLQAGYWDIFWPQFLQGLAMALVFIPLTTVTMDPIPKERMGNATSVFNVMRNLGGSFGIAATTTILARSSQGNIQLIGSHVTALNQQTQVTLHALAGNFSAHGGDPTGAAQQAYGAMFGLVARQASMLAFVHTFRLLAIIFVLIVPALLLLKKPAHSRGAAPMH